ncbi:MAG TPA: hypothetical protein VHD90_10570 [Phototrophicaceae bacterium]|nr:hypothetical protein [Phototrophicaceae bacterium]
MLRGLLFALAVFVVAGCAAVPTEKFALGDPLADIDFSQSFMWQQYVHPEQHVDFEITHDEYEAKAWDGGFMWTIQPPQQTDTVIDVTTTQLSSYDNNAYGVMCRALPTDNGDGYYFLISGDGQYTIRRGAVDDIKALIPFTASSAINQHQNGINQIRAVCIGTYLALYVNGQFVAETHDDYFTKGYTGLSVAVVKGSDATADIVYDDLKVSAASLLP